MAWNPSPKVAAAREIGARFGCPQVVIVLIDQERGTLESISYGKTQRLCRDAQSLGDAAWEAVYRKIEALVEEGQ